MTARALVLATNAHTGEIARRLTPRLARTLIPAVSWQMATEPLGANLRGAILPGRQAVSNTRGDLRFFRHDARHRLITGGAVAPGPNAARRVRAKAARALHEAFPQLGAPRMTHLWNGYVGMSRDRFPHVHRLGPDGWAWLACNGRGVALAMSLGREIARAVAGEPVEELALPVTDPEPSPAHAFLRRVAPGYLAWLRRSDRVEMRSE